MESLLKSIKCKKCFELLEKPVVLPCGNCICEKHQHEDRDDNNSVYCRVCDLHHEIPPNGGFVRNLPLEELIEQKIDCIDLGDEYRSAYNKLENFSDMFERFEKLKNDPDDRIYSKISKLRNKIDLRREELKNKIDEDALSIIKQLDEYELECKANIPSFRAEIEEIEKLNDWKEDLDRWRQQMRIFKKDIDKWKKIHEEASVKYVEMSMSYYKFHGKLFLNRLADYKNLKLFVGNDFDMIKNHSLTFLVKDVTKSINNDKYIYAYSETFRSFGLDWSLAVESSEDDDGDECVVVLLFVNGDFSKETCDISFDILILHRTDPSKNLKYERKDTFIDSFGSGTDLLIKLNDLISNDEFFDAENDCFTVQIKIKSVEFKSIEKNTE